MKAKSWIEAARGALKPVQLSNAHDKYGAEDWQVMLHNGAEPFRIADFLEEHGHPLAPLFKELHENGGDQGPVGSYNYVAPWGVLRHKEANIKTLAEVIHDHHNDQHYVKLYQTDKNEASGGALKVEAPVSKATAQAVARHFKMTPYRQYANAFSAPPEQPTQMARKKLYADAVEVPGLRKTDLKTGVMPELANTRLAYHMKEAMSLGDDDLNGLIKQALQNKGDPATKTSAEKIWSSIGGRLKALGHRLAGVYNWGRMGHAIEVDRAVRAYVQKMKVKDESKRYQTTLKHVGLDRTAMSGLAPDDIKQKFWAGLRAHVDQHFKRLDQITGFDDAGDPKTKPRPGHYIPKTHFTDEMLDRSLHRLAAKEADAHDLKNAKPGEWKQYMSLIPTKADGRGSAPEQYARLPRLPRLPDSVRSELQEIGHFGSWAYGEVRDDLQKLKNRFIPPPRPTNEGAMDVDNYHGQKEQWVDMLHAPISNDAAGVAGIADHLEENGHPLHAAFKHIVGVGHINPEKGANVNLDSRVVGIPGHENGNEAKIAFHAGASGKKYITIDTKDRRYVAGGLPDHEHEAIRSHYADQQRPANPSGRAPNVQLSRPTSAAEDNTGRLATQRSEILKSLVAEARLKLLRSAPSQELHASGFYSGLVSEVAHNSEPDAVDYVGHWYSLLTHPETASVFHVNEQGNDNLHHILSPLAPHAAAEKLAPLLGVAQKIRVVKSPLGSDVYVINPKDPKPFMGVLRANSRKHHRGTFQPLRSSQSPAADPSAAKADWRDQHTSAIRKYEVSAPG